MLESKQTREKPKAARRRSYTPRSERHRVLELIARQVASAPESGQTERWPERLSASARAAITQALRRAHGDGSFFGAVRELATVASLLGHGLQRPQLGRELLELAAEVGEALGTPREASPRGGREAFTGSRRTVRAPKVGERAPANSMKAGRLNRTLRM